MSEAPTEVTPEQAQSPAPEAPAQEIDWKAEARKWEGRAKENKGALDELTGKYTTVETRVGELSKKVQDFEAEKERAEILSDVAEKSGVPASALRGNTRDELEAHAADLAKLIKPSGPIIPGQEKAPQRIPDSPNAEFARKLFGSD
ncbi:hypothetical protein LJ753_16810 [Arthrobacter sp. zg-Y20]|uniref:hypothetical protein n=1 Tax=unclassified Arthrobacter TaxID=235627 RepID=UPI001D145E36|nr:MULTISPECIES: hypothetical protein [unclassified Arthrobacter]MCC3277527.1 hypothetical protein [Arthrobacter sp. zg-Y20]MDK1317685.1 hypothetical protein [Arthrobacter sp. zg.Y20]WIB07056.1 hypothetical protein QNO06_04830 [Arthrobacter sp. zg-Y20]